MAGVEVRLAGRHLNPESPPGPAAALAGQLLLVSIFR